MLHLAQDVYQHWDSNPGKVGLQPTAVTAVPSPHVKTSSGFSRIPPPLIFSSFDGIKRLVFSKNIVYKKIYFKNLSSSAGISISSASLESNSKFSIS